MIIILLLYTSLEDETAENCRHNSLLQENFDLVSESIVEEPIRSINRRLQQGELGKSTKWPLLRKNLVLKDYLVQITQELNSLDHLMKIGIVESFLEIV